MIKCDIIYDSELLKKDLRLKRLIELELGMDACSKEIGISKATLSRVEKGNMPDLLTFFKVIKWLNSNPNNYIKYGYGKY
jgi:transcriptional regulator with XRE-family HTH domain